MTREESEFAQEMRKQGVKPLTKTVKVPARTAGMAPEKRRLAPEVLRRRQQAVAESPMGEALGDSVRDWLGPHDIVEFRRPGVQHGQFKDFKQGKLKPQATLDLHRCTVADAREMLLAFVRDCQGQGLRCGLVMHGKGFHSRSREEGSQSENKCDKEVSRIKSFTVHWLQQMEAVLALASAQPKRGGTGALYVLFTSRGGAGKLPPPR